MAIQTVKFHWQRMPLTMKEKHTWHFPSVPLILLGIGAPGVVRWVRVGECNELMINAWGLIESNLLVLKLFILRELLVSELRETQARLCLRIGFLARTPELF